MAYGGCSHGELGFIGPHSAQERGFRPDEWGEPPPRQPWNASSMDAGTNFDGYDVGIRYADDAVGVLLNKLADLNVLEDTAVQLAPIMVRLSVNLECMPIIRQLTK